MEWFEEYFGGLYGDVLEAVFPPEASLSQARAVAALLDLQKSDRVLDVPCGMGRVAVPLAKTGFRVTGVDAEAGFIDAARRRVQEEQVDARFLRCDMREISFEEEFEGAFNWFTSFGYFSDEENLAFLERVFAALKPGGRFAVDLVNKAWLVSNFIERTIDEVAGVRIEDQRRWNAASSRLESETVFEKGGKSERHKVSIRLYGGEEMKNLLSTAGFVEVRLSSGDGRGPFTASSPRLVAVAVKGDDRGPA